MALHPEWPYIRGPCMRGTLHCKYTKTNIMRIISTTIRTDFRHGGRPRAWAS